MKSAWITNIALIALVTALALYAIYRPGSEDAAERYPVSTLSKSTVDRILIEPKGGPVVALRKEGDDWMLAQPYVARADRTQVDRLLDLLAARSKEKLAAGDLRRFDLDAPALKVTFNDKAIAFGTSNPLSQEQYVLSSDAVYLVAGYYRSLVPDQAQRLLTHALFKSGEKPVAFRLPGLSVRQRDGKWEMDPLPPGTEEKDRPSQDDLNRWVDDWKLSSSLLTQFAPDKAASEWIEIQLANGKSVRLDIAQREPELVLVRADEKLSFFFSRETSKRLLSPPVVVHRSEAPAAATPAPPSR